MNETTNFRHQDRFDELGHRDAPRVTDRLERPVHIGIELRSHVLTLEAHGRAAPCSEEPDAAAAGE